MTEDRTRPDSVGSAEVVPSAPEQEAPEQPTGAFGGHKRIVPSLSALAITFLSVDWAQAMASMGGHGGGHH